jgi:hypothetical protein
MIYKVLLFLFCSIIPQISFLQDNKPNNYHSPLGIPLVLAANFGELRPNHFHMGVDFKTNGNEGLSLFSIDQGYVARVKVSPYGYGKVVYIAHPNGMTSVYAHCSSFKGKLDSIVKKVQNEEQNFEIEIYFTPSDIPVKKGEIIALSGNTGGSTAPHLHFEIRETATDVAVNPLLYGFKISDSKAPEIRAVKVYALTEEGYQIPGKSKVYPITSGKQGPKLANDELIVPADYCSETGGIGFSFDVIDYYDAALNVCGLYGSTLRSGKDTVFCQKIDQVSFDDSRYVNTHKDYMEYTTSKRKFHKSFKSENNPLTIYPSKHLGVIKAKPGDSLHLTYSVFDVKGNATDLQFSLKVQKGAMNKNSAVFPASNYFLPDSSYFFQRDKIEISASKLTFYEPTKKNLALKGEPFTFGDPAQPIQNPLTIKMTVPSTYLSKSKYSESWRKKYCIGFRNRRKSDYCFFLISWDIQVKS